MSDLKETESEPKPSPNRAKLIKGCGCLTGLVVMMLGILIIGGFDKAAWASAVIGGVVGVLVFAMSGVNGIWED